MSLGRDRESRKNVYGDNIKWSSCNDFDKLTMWTVWRSPAGCTICTLTVPFQSVGRHTWPVIYRHFNCAIVRSDPRWLLTVHHAHAEIGVPVRRMELPAASDHRLSVPANRRVEKLLGVVTTAF